MENLETIVTYGGIALLFLLMWRIWIIPVKWLVKLLISSAVATVLLILVNTLGASYGLAIGVNPITALIGGVLGIPGICLLLLLHLFV